MQASWQICLQSGTAGNQVDDDFFLDHGKPAFITCAVEQALEHTKVHCTPLGVRGNCQA